jgi:putative restriction endonuclease
VEGRLTGIEQAVIAIQSLKPWARKGERAPHKPLLILLPIGRLQAGKSRLMDFNDIEIPLRDLLRQFGPPRKSYHPEYPFWRLQQDQIWEIVNPHTFPSRLSNTDPPVSALRKWHALGGFVADLHAELKSEPDKTAQLADLTATIHLPDVKADVLAACGVASLRK